jgi:hypothetical protein
MKGGEINSWFVLKNKREKCLSEEAYWNGD